MSLFKMLFQEIRYRKAGFFAGCIAVAVVTTALIGAWAAFKAHQLDTVRILAAHEKKVAAETALLKDEIRKATLQFNAIVLPEGQELQEWFMSDTGSKTMPESYVQKLSESRLISIRHILPSLQRWVEWPEQNRQVLLVGTRGEAADLHKNPKVPIVQPVPDGAMVLGSEIAEAAGLKKGDTTQFKGHAYTVHRIHDERGSKDDTTVWIPLADAQEMLGEEGRVNAIMALQCMCVGKEGLPRVRSDIQGVLPGTQVHELGSDKALARIEARSRVNKEARQALKREEKHRKALLAKIDKITERTLPVILLAAGVWIAVLGYGNVLQRREELAVLRATGCRSRFILALFLTRSLFMGVVGAVIGLAGGLAAAWVLTGWLAESGLRLSVIRNILSRPMMLGLMLLAAPALAAVAGWLPSFKAAQMDPARILSEE